LAREFGIAEKRREEIGETRTVFVAADQDALERGAQIGANAHAHGPRCLLCKPDPCTVHRQACATQRATKPRDIGGKLSGGGITEQHALLLALQ
jgi:hypothetical protein